MRNRYLLAAAHVAVAIVSWTLLLGCPPSPPPAAAPVPGSTTR